MYGYVEVELLDTLREGPRLTFLCERLHSKRVRQGTSGAA